MIKTTETDNGVLYIGNATNTLYVKVKPETCKEKGWPPIVFISLVNGTVHSYYSEDAVMMRPFHGKVEIDV